ncbi:L-seryl-tRNA(Sec) kinase, putative [Hepatocystis sp. ex Piliocolobus tephrosceles]|nr:L-seryl-tRNA(Sec) kinase, putative [Hepatocystis sp. ex Piliocolobus tephrosceles]
MNMLVLFYGKPCSGKDYFINFLLKRKKEINFFIYILFNLTEECSSYKNLNEKNFFIQLIKHYYYTKTNVNKRASIKLCFKYNKNQVKEKRIPFSFFIYVIKNIVMQRQNNTQVISLCNILNCLKKKIKKVKNNYIIKNNTTKYCNKIIKRKKSYYIICNNKTKHHLFFIFYKNKKRWLSYFSNFQKEYKTNVYNISTDLIEKQLYNGTNKNKILFSIKKKKSKLYNLFKKKIIIYQKKKYIYNVPYYYPIVKKTNIKNDLFIIKCKTKKKVTLNNQTKYWHWARKIAYTYCKSLIREQVQRNKNTNKRINGEKNIKKKYNIYRSQNSNKIIILNDTFHLPSMRKKYYLLGKKYHFNYLQVYIYASLKTCLRRNKTRNKFKFVSNNTIIKNHAYHEKYALSLKYNHFPDLTKFINVFNGSKHWQKQTKTIVVNSDTRKHFTEVLLFIYNNFKYFKYAKKETTFGKNKEQEKKKPTDPSYLEVLNNVINKIIHEKLQEVSNYKKNEYAMKFRLIKLQLLKEGRTKKTLITDDIKDKFVIE